MRIVCPNPIRNDKSVARSYPISVTQTRSVVQFPTIAERNLELYHALWFELHSKQDATPEWFNAWVKRVPQASCSCKRELDAYIVQHPVDYNRFEDWGIDLHNFVNARLGKPLWIKPDAAIPKTSV